MSECSVFGCQKSAEFGVANSTTERLDENWRACLDHVPRIIRFLVERSDAWGMEANRVVLIELASGRVQSPTVDT